MPKYKFITDCEIEVWEDYDEVEDHGEKSMEVFKAGEIADFDILTESDEGTHVDIQFGDGAVALTIDRTWFEEIKVKDNYPNGLCPDCAEDIPDDADDGSKCDNCGHVFYSEAFNTIEE